VDAEETSVLRLDRNAEQQAFKSRPGRALEILAVLANTEVPMFPTRRYRGQHATQGAVHDFGARIGPWRSLKEFRDR
jgi:hypothetical protein